MIQKTFEQLLEQFNQLPKEKEKLAFNVFSISNQRAHHENFHSDIIAELLNPNGKHGEGSLFLELFLDYLNQFDRKDAPILKISDFNKAEREKNRIDITIFGDKKAIIIENKVNQAPDQKEQLKRYYGKLTKDNKEVNDIIYLTLRGLHKPPSSIDEVERKIRHMALCNPQKFDLLSGWLYPCLLQAKSVHSTSFLRQYIRLVEYLSFVNRENEVLEDIYEYVDSSRPKNIKDKFGDKISALKIQVFRKEKLQKAIPKKEPFSKENSTYRNGSFYILDDYMFEDRPFQLGVRFEENGDAVASFQEYGSDKIDKAIEILKEIGVNTFKVKDNCYHKYFKMGDFDNSPKKIDDAVLDLFQHFISELNSMNLTLKKNTKK